MYSNAQTTYRSSQDNFTLLYRKIQVSRCESTEEERKKSEDISKKLKK